MQRKATSAAKDAPTLFKVGLAQGAEANATLRAPAAAVVLNATSTRAIVAVHQARAEANELLQVTHIGHAAMEKLLDAGPRLSLLQSSRFADHEGYKFLGMGCTFFFMVVFLVLSRFTSPMHRGLPGKKADGLDPPPPTQRATLAVDDDEPLPAKTVAWIILNIAVPSVIGSCLVIFNEVTSTVFLGRVGTQAELAAVGLGNLMQNCVALSCGLGICGALDTLVSQAYGSGQDALSCYYLQRCRVLVTLQLFWMVPVLYYADRILIFTGQDPEVSMHAGHYCRATSIGLFFMFQNTATTSFLKNRGNLVAPMIMVLCANLQQCGLCAFFVVHCGWGNYGAGVANAVANATGFVISSIYLAYVAQQQGLSKRSVLWVEAGGLRELGEYMKLAVPATLSTCIEWWFWEIASLFAGFLGQAPLAAHVATANFNSVCFMAPAGLGSAASAMVGHYIGARKPNKAKTMVWIFALTAVGTWATLALPVVAFRHYVAQAYSQDAQVQEIMAKLLCIFALSGFGDSTQVVIGGALRGVGLQSLTAGVFVVAYYIVTLPLAALAAFHMGMGIFGMWWGFVLGTGLAAVAFLGLVFHVDFHAKVEECAERLRRDEAAVEG